MLRSSQFPLPNNAQVPSTTISFVWSNGGGDIQTLQPRPSTCQSNAVEAQLTNARLFSPGSTMSTCTPRIAATSSA